MTAPSTAKKTTPAKAATPTPEKVEEKQEVPTENVETTETENVEKTEKVPTVPNALQSNPILAEFCKRYLDNFNDITTYNKQVLADKESEWNGTKLLAKAKEFASPDDAKDAKPEFRTAYDKYEDLLSQVSEARKALISLAAKELDVKLDSVADKDPEKEAKLKEQRKLAVEIGNQLVAIAGMTQDVSTKETVTKFLEEYPLPAVGRDQVRSFTDNAGKGTPKYRVTVTVSKGDNVLMDGEGFSKTAINLSRPEFGYERGKAPKADKLREAWEKAGNTAEKTVQDPVTFTDNGLTFTIRKK